MSLQDRLCWTAAVYRTIDDVYGSLRHSKRLHWTRWAACQEAGGWLRDLDSETAFDWQFIDEEMAVGRTPTYYVIVRSVLLPEGERPIDDPGCQVVE